MSRSLSVTAATTTHECAAIAKALDARATRPFCSRQQGLPALGQRDDVRLRQQADSVGPHALSVGSLHHNIGVPTYWLARRRHEGNSLSRHLDHVRWVDRVQVARLQLDQGQSTCAITVRPIHPCRNPDGSFRFEQPLGIDQPRSPQLLRKPSIQVAWTRLPQPPPDGGQRKRDQRGADGQRVSGHGFLRAASATTLDTTS